jgi:MFS family permease
MAVTGGGLGPIYQKVLSNITPKRKRGQVFGWTSTFSGIGNMASSLVAGWFIYIFGTRGVFYSGAILTLLLVPVMQIMLKKILNQPYYRANTAKKQE